MGMATNSSAAMECIPGDGAPNGQPHRTGIDTLAGGPVLRHPGCPSFKPKTLAALS